MWADHFEALGSPSEIETFDKDFFNKVSGSVRESLFSFLTDPGGVLSEPLEYKEIVHVCSTLKLGISGVEIHYEHIRFAGPPFWKLLFQLYQTFFNNFSVCDSLLTGVIVKFLQDKKKYRKKRAKISADISARLFRVTCNKVSGILTNTQRLNCRCQELDLTYLTVSLVPTWGIFTPPSELLPHLENFIPSPKNVRNTITIANTNIFVGRKMLPPEFVAPKITPLQKCFYSSDSCKFYFLQNLDVSC